MLDSRILQYVHVALSWLRHSHSRLCQLHMHTEKSNRRTGTASKNLGRLHGYVTYITNASLGHILMHGSSCLHQAESSGTPEMVAACEHRPSSDPAWWDPRPRAEHKAKSETHFKITSIAAATAALHALVACFLQVNGRLRVFDDFDNDTVERLCCTFSIQLAQKSLTWDPRINSLCCGSMCTRSFRYGNELNKCSGQEWSLL